jgi:hypothetical protein
MIHKLNYKKRGKEKVMRRLGYVVLSLLIIISFSPFLSWGAEHPVKLYPAIGYSLKNDLSPPLSQIRPIPPGYSKNVREIPTQPIPRPMPRAPEVPAEDPVVQDRQGEGSMPATIRNFEGIGNVNGVLPPDTNGDVGPNHYVQIVNLSFAIFDKSGNRLYGPADNNTIWSGFGGPCETRNDGDPIVLYDHLADRWVISQFALPNFPYGPFYQCIAISQTGDPMGAWYRYSFLVHNTKMNDYPKFGLWPDGYYMSVNQFDPWWAGAGLFVFERDRMLLGQPARFLYYDLGSVDERYGGLLPADLDGPPPPQGSPAYFVSVDDSSWGFSRDTLHIWEVHVDWATPSNSTITGPTDIPTASFNPNMCNYSRDCIPQPDTTRGLDAISDRLMYRLQYRNFGSYEVMVVNHTVDVDGTDHAGIRWYELRKTNGSWSIHQQGTFAPDSHNRWMGSIAMDGDGNIALGYSISSNTMYPSIGYVGRLSTDPLGTLPQGEGIIILGGGSQTHSSSRWGDYSSMSVDPVDDCTFWYTQEYYQTTSSSGWQTRIASFRFPSCGAPTGDPVPDIKANGSDGPVNVSQGSVLSVTVTLDPGNRAGDDADWWMAANTPFGWYSYNGTDWIYAGPSYTDLTVTYQQPLSSYGPVEILNTTGLPLGKYTFYFAVDMIMNGLPDMDQKYLDKVIVNIVQVAE